MLSIRRGSDALDEQQRRILQEADHPGQKPGGGHAVGDPVVEGQGERKYGADDDGAVMHPGALGDAAEADDRHIGPVDDRGGKQPAEMRRSW